MRVLIGTLLVLLLAACGKPPVQMQEAFVFGTRVEVLVADADVAKAKAATATVLREFDRLHRTYHAWQPSELTALNAAIAGGKTHAVTPELAGFIVDAQAVTKEQLGLMMTEALPHYQEAPRLLLAPILVMGVMLLALVLLNQKGTYHPGPAQGVTP